MSSTWREIGKAVMNTLRRIQTILWVSGALAVAQPLPSLAQSDASKSNTPRAQRDGQRDFDFNLGTWNTHMRRLQDPLTGSNTWVELNGTVVVRKVWGGRAQLEGVEADGPTGHFEDLALFLYDPRSHQWSQTFSNSNRGTLSQPMIGEFANGRGQFIDQEPFNGRVILVRAVWSDITPDSHRFEQSFSDDEGKTWETNFVATLTRKIPIADETKVQSTGPQRPGQHDFDFEFGTWKIHVDRLQHPLTGSTRWMKFDGTVVDREVWSGRANLAEIAADGPDGHLEFLSLRLYNLNRINGV
jgi:hypothetical protein